MKKCLKCSKEMQYKYLSNIKSIDLKEGRLKCPQCKEYNFVTKETIVDFSHVVTMPFYMMVVLLFAPINFWGYLLAVLGISIISKYIKAWFIEFSDKDPFEETIKK